VKTIINNIELKLEKLIIAYKKVQQEKSDLQIDNNALAVKLQEKEEQTLALQDKVKLMSISKSVDINKDGVKATRSKINEYVREIDKCIALLNK
tara:strand:- start:5006 stop:5287 length:282 start_codon:yes stop_codon:yes gene_type:complete